MIPTKLAELLVFIVMLAPGLAYVLRHERVVPARTHSVFRETLRVLYVSVTCLIFTAIVFAGLRWWVPRRTPDVNALVTDTSRYVKAHYVELAWWSLGLLAFATALGALMADRRVVLVLNRIHMTRPAELLFGRPTIGHTSSWYKAFHLGDAPNGKGGSRENSDQPYTWVGAQMEDGSYIEGKAISYNWSVEENENREIVLLAPRVTTKKADRIPMSQHVTVLSARHIVRLDITFVTPTRLTDVPDQPDKASSVDSREEDSILQR